MSSEQEQFSRNGIRILRPIPADHPNMRWTRGRDEKGASIEPDWRRGISKPHKRNRPGKHTPGIKPRLIRGETDEPAKREGQNERPLETCSGA